MNKGTRAYLVDRLMEDAFKFKSGIRSDYAYNSDGNELLNMQLGKLIPSITDLNISREVPHVNMTNQRSTPRPTSASRKGKEPVKNNTQSLSEYERTTLAKVRNGQPLSKEEKRLLRDTRKRIAKQ